MLRTYITMLISLLLFVSSLWSAGVGTVPAARKELFDKGVFLLPGAVITAPAEPRARVTALVLADELNRRNPGTSIKAGPAGNIRLILGKSPRTERAFQKKEGYTLEETELPLQER